MLKSLSLKEIWTETYGDPRIRIAVLDGPVDCSHLTLVGASLLQLDGIACTTNDTGPASQHGTHVVSLIFAQHHTSILGISPHCQGILIPIFKDDKDGSLIACSQYELASALRKAVDHRVHIVNISAGELSLSGTAEPVLVDAVRACVAAGILIIASVGNQGCECLNIPSCLPSVLAVGAMDKLGDPMNLNNWGEAYEKRGILGPGEELLVAKPGGGTSFVSGTSFATAHVSGIAALLLSVQLKYGQRPDPVFVGHLLLDSALKTEGDSPRAFAGRLNVKGALSLVMQRINMSSAELLSSSSLISVSPDRTGLTVLGPRDLPGSIDSSPFDGPYVPAVWALKDKYNGVRRDKFGTVDIRLPNGGCYNVRDLHYFFNGYRRGLRLIPVNDDGESYYADKVPGYQVVDDFLRHEMALERDGPIYALISYTRPDEHYLSLDQLVSTKKVQLGHQHLGAYIGEGRTTHALEKASRPEWKSKGRYVAWNVQGRPANVHLISLQGVEQRILNKNAQIVDAVLTSGVLAPVDTQNVKSRACDLNTILQFYRDWIRDADYLKDFTWYTNCSNHKTIVVNVMLNVPHNQQQFETIFGNDGVQLWQDFKRKYHQTSDREFTDGDETQFRPLWEQEGLSAESICPLTLADYNTFQAAKAERRLDGYTGRRPLEPGKGMAWPLETLADVTAGLMGMYVSVADVGGIVPALMLLALKSHVQERSDISDAKYLEVVKPIVRQLIVADALANAPSNPLWLRQTTVELYTGLGGRPEDLSPTGTVNDFIIHQVEDYLTDATRELDNITNGKPKGPFEIAHWLNNKLAPEIESAKTLVTSDERRTGFFSSPAIAQRIALGMYRKSAFVTIRTVCTVMAYDELETSEESLLRNEPGRPVPNFNANRRTANANQRRYTHAINPGESSGRGNLELSSGIYMNDQPNRDTISTARSTSPSEGLAPVLPSSLEPSACSGPGSGGIMPLVYVLGKVNYDLVSQSRRDSLKQKMEEWANPEDPEQFLTYVEANPWDASAVQWTLNVDNTPLYVIQPQGPFAKEAYNRLRQCLREQLTEGVERVSIPGVIAGTARLRTGYVVPVVVPEIRGMYSWTTDALVRALGAEPPAEGASQEQREAFVKIQNGVRGFLERVYYELRNPGLTPQERALNFAGTNAFAIASVYEVAIREDMELDCVDLERSPIALPGADCWDVKLSFFFPQRQVQTVRKVYRFTVDVTDVVPSTVGAVRSWFIR